MILYVTRRKQEADEENDQPETEIKRRGILRLFSAVVAVGSIIVFVLTEDMSLPMQWTDKWTVVMAVLAVIQVLTVIFAKKKEQEVEEDETYA